VIDELVSQACQIARDYRTWTPSDPAPDTTDALVKLFTTDMMSLERMVVVHGVKLQSHLRQALQKALHALLDAGTRYSYPCHSPAVRQAASLCGNASRLPQLPVSLHMPSTFCCSISVGSCSFAETRHSRDLTAVAGAFSQRVQPEYWRRLIPRALLHSRRHRLCRGGADDTRTGRIHQTDVQGSQSAAGPGNAI